MKRTCLALAAMGLSATLAFAQTPSPTRGQPGQNPPATSGPTARQDATGSIGSAATRDFVQKVAASDLFEIESSRLALQKAKSPQLKDFAQQMVSQHTESSAKLKAAAAKSGLSAPNAKLEAKEQAQLTELKNAGAEEFDRKYMTAQQAAHSQAITLFQAYLTNSDKPEIAAFARDVLPVIQHHKQMIDALAGV